MYYYRLHIFGIVGQLTKTHFEILSASKSKDLATGNFWALLEVHSAEKPERSTMHLWTNGILIIEATPTTDECVGRSDVAPFGEPIAGIELLT